LSRNQALTENDEEGSMMPTVKCAYCGFPNNDTNRICGLCERPLPCIANVVRQMPTEKHHDDIEIGGLIRYYGLEDWWQTTFSDKERSRVIERYRPLGLSEVPLASGEVGYSSHSIDLFLSGLATWFRSHEDRNIQQKINEKLRSLTGDEKRSKPGYLGNRHFTTYTVDVELLKQDGKLDEAVKLLTRIIECIEDLCKQPPKRSSPTWQELFPQVDLSHVKETSIEVPEVAPPWYYEQLAIVYRKRKDYVSEVAILEHYLSLSYGIKKPRIIARLDRARQLLEKHTGKQ
jgi:hypothetical protein